MGLEKRPRDPISHGWGREKYEKTRCSPSPPPTSKQLQELVFSGMWSSTHSPFLDLYLWKPHCPGEAKFSSSAPPSGQSLPQRPEHSSSGGLAVHCLHPGLQEWAGEAP